MGTIQDQLDKAREVVAELERQAAEYERQAANMPTPTAHKEEWVVGKTLEYGVYYASITQDQSTIVRETAKVFNSYDDALDFTKNNELFTSFVPIPVHAITPQPEGEVIWLGHVAEHKKQPGKYYLSDPNGIPDLFQPDPFHDNDLMNSEGEKMKDHAVYNKPIPVRLVKGGGES